MITHYIYEIVGRKVGCCKSLEYRMKRYDEREGTHPKFVRILERLHDKTDQEAGDIEWSWADKLGYRRGVHYTVSMNAYSARGRRGGRSSNSPNGGLRRAEILSPERIVEISRNAGLRAREVIGLEGYAEMGRRGAARRAETITPERLSEIGRMGAARFLEVTTPEQRSRNARKANDSITPEKRLEIQQDARERCLKREVCPHCGLESNLPILRRWHFDNCKYKPKIGEEA